MPYLIILRTEMLMEKSHWENWIIEQRYLLWCYLVSHTFPTNCKHCYILRLNIYICVSKIEETNHFQYKYTFYDQDHIRWISNFYYNYTTRKLNSLSLTSYYQTSYCGSFLPSDLLSIHCQSFCVFLHSMYVSVQYVNIISISQKLLCII